MAAIGNTLARDSHEAALRVKTSMGAPLEVQNGTQQELIKIIDFVDFEGQKKKIFNILKTKWGGGGGGFKMGHHPGIHHLEQKCALLCSEWCCVEMGQVNCGICKFGLFVKRYVLW